MEQTQNGLLEMLLALLESEPAYVIGREMIRRLAAETGMQEQEAQEALLYAAPSGTEALCACAAQELVRLNQAGRDVDHYLADQAFVQLLREMPVHAALRLYDAEESARRSLEQERALGAQDLLEKIMARRDLPLPIRGGMPAEGRADYSTMSSAEFAAAKKRLAQAAAAGHKPGL